MLCVQIYCVCIGLLFAVFSTVNRIGLVYVLESSVSVEYSWRSGCHKLSIYIDYSNFQPKNSTFSETLTEKFQNLQVNCWCHPLYISSKPQRHSIVFHNVPSTWDLIIRIRGTFCKYATCADTSRDKTKIKMETYQHGMTGSLLQFWCQVPCCQIIR